MPTSTGEGEEPDAIYPCANPETEMIVSRDSIVFESAEEFDEWCRYVWRRGESGTNQYRDWAECLAEFRASRETK